MGWPSQLMTQMSLCPKFNSSFPFKKLTPLLMPGPDGRKWDLPEARAFEVERNIGHLNFSWT